MKKLYLSALTILIACALQAQDVNSYSLEGSCVSPDDGTVTLMLDLNRNCPEADPTNALSGSDLGFHSGVNTWGSVVAWDNADAITLSNPGNDTFLVTINLEDYYGVPFGDVVDIMMVPNNGVAEPGDPWTTVFADTMDNDFGNPDCSDLRLFIDQTPTCADLNQGSSLSLFSDAGDSESCVDTDDGLIRVDIDYDLACPEGDPMMMLAGASALGFHSGINNWSTVVAWDDANAATLVNDGNDNFSVVIDVEAYYGVPLADIQDIYMVPNNGVADPAAPWDITVKDPRDGGFGGTEPCSDLIMIISEAPACDLVSSTVDVQLQHSFKAAPNPFRNRTFLEFDNPNNQIFELEITNVAGQTVRTMSGITGERVLIEREGLSDGIFVARLIDENGNFATTKLVVK